jgi:hypothetical protein
LISVDIGNGTRQRRDILNALVIRLLETSMAKAKAKSSKSGKERIIPPSKKDTSAGSDLLRESNPAGGRVMADKFSLDATQHQGW